MNGRQQVTHTAAPEIWNQSSVLFQVGDVTNESFDEKMRTLALRFASGEGRWDGQADLPFFTHRKSVVNAAIFGLPLNAERLKYLKVIIHPVGTVRPEEGDKDPDGRCTDSWYLFHTSWGWREHFCQGGAEWLHVIRDCISAPAEAADLRREAAHA
jgi:hypothetical protein